MSRIGKKSVSVPKGVTANVSGQSVTVKGPKGELKFLASDDVHVKFADGKITIEPSSETKKARSAWGMSRTMVSNLMKGVTAGFERKLEINGVGYRADVAGQKLNMALGFSHPVSFDLPKGIAAKVDKNIVILTGIDKEILGETASKIRAIRPPEPYKGKGIKYVEEVIKRKVGKTGAA